MLYSGCSPASGNRFGTMPSDTCAAKEAMTCQATSNRPVTRQRPGNEMNVSRPQSVNQGYPGDHRLLRPSLGEVPFRSTPEFASQRISGWCGLPDCIAASLLAFCEGDDVEPVDGIAGKGQRLGGSGLKIERELSGRPPVFFGIESTLLFDRELYVPIPLWFMAIPSWVENPHWGQIGVRMPHDHSTPDLGLRREASILVVRPMIVPPGELRSHPQHNS